MPRIFGMLGGMKPNASRQRTNAANSCIHQRRVTDAWSASNEWRRFMDEALRWL
jgi:hypothetical protein